MSWKPRKTMKSEMLHNLRLKAMALWHSDRYRTDILQFIEFGIGYFAVLIVGYLLVRKINLSLSDVEMGRFSYVQSIVMIVAPVLYLAAPNAYLRFHEDHCVPTRLRAFLMPFYWFAFVALALLIFFCTRSFVALLYAFFPFFMEKTYFLRAQMEVRKLNILRTLELLLPLVALYAAASRVEPTGDMVLGFYGIGYAVAFLFRARGTGEGEIDRREIVRYLTPIVFTSLLVFVLNNVSVVATKHYWGYEAAGQMGVAVRALLFLRSLSGLFMMFYPMIYFREAKKGNDGIVRLYRNVIILVVAAFSAGLVAFAPLVYRILGAAGYTGTVNVFRILVGAEFLNFLIDVYCLYFSLEIKTWKGTIVKVIAVAVLAAGLGAIPWLHLAPEAHLPYVAYTVLAAALTSSAIGGVWALCGERRHMRSKRA